MRPCASNQGRSLRVRLGGDCACAVRNLMMGCDTTEVDDGTAARPPPPPGDEALHGSSGSGWELSL